MKDRFQYRFQHQRDGSLGDSIAVSVIPLSDGIGATLLDGQSTARADMTCSVCRLAQK